MPDAWEVCSATWLACFGLTPWRPCGQCLLCFKLINYTANSLPLNCERWADDELSSATRPIPALFTRSERLQWRALSASKVGLGLPLLAIELPNRSLLCCDRLRVIFWICIAASQLHRQLLLSWLALFIDTRPCLRMLVKFLCVWFACLQLAERVFNGCSSHFALTISGLFRIG